MFQAEITLPNVDECFLLRSRKWHFWTHELQNRVWWNEDSGLGETEVFMLGEGKDQCLTKHDERIAVLTKCCALDRFSFGDEGLLFKYLKRCMADGY
jgi:hypothetical protein